LKGKSFRKEKKGGDPLSKEEGEGPLTFTSGREEGGEGPSRGGKKKRGSLL